MKNSCYLVSSMSDMIMIRYPVFTPWAKISKAITPLAHSHGGLKKDVSAIESLYRDARLQTDPEDVEIAKKIEAAYGGQTDVFRDWWLYDWNGLQFQLVRKPEGVTRDPLPQEKIRGLSFPKITAQIVDALQGCEFHSLTERERSIYLILEGQGLIKRN